MNKSTIYYSDGHKEELETKIAYQIWLNTPGTALRTFGDTRPVQSWEYSDTGRNLN